MAQNRTGGYDEVDTRRKQADIEKKVVQKEKQMEPQRELTKESNKAKNRRTTQHIQTKH